MKTSSLMFLISTPVRLATTLCRIRYMDRSLRCCSSICYRQAEPREYDLPNFSVRLHPQSEILALEFDDSVASTGNARRERMRGTRLRTANKIVSAIADQTGGLFQAGISEYWQTMPKSMYSGIIWNQCGITPQPPLLNWKNCMTVVQG